MSQARVSHRIADRVILAGIPLIYFCLLTVLLGGSGLAFITTEIQAANWASEPIVSLLWLALFTAVFVNALAKWVLLLAMRAPCHAQPGVGLRVAVATTYVGDAESMEMLERTLRAVVGIRYPHDSWVLDESDDPRVRALCHSIGAKHFTRKHLDRYQTSGGAFERATKHGNYNAWLSEIGLGNYEFITGLDPDHIPSKCFLDRVLGYFADGSVGYVQAAQAYYNQSASFVARGAAEETYDYNSTIQMASYGLAYPIIMGCHNTHRSEALREVGGFAAHDADDLLITILYRAKGWHGVFVPEIIARGLTPVGWGGYLRQQRRWARSVLDIKLRIQPHFLTGLPLHSQLMSYLHGLNYLQPALLFCGFCFLIMFSVCSARVPRVLASVKPTSAAIAALALTVCFLFRQRFFLDPQTERGLLLRARLLRIIKAPYLLLALADVLLDRRPPYEITSKIGNKKTFGLLPVYLPLSAFFLGAWLLGHATHPSYPKFLDVLTLTLLLACGGLLASEWLPSPPPYDAALPVVRDPDQVDSL